jgi:hypothetical protein
MIRRLGFVSSLLLTLAFAAPAFESHACPDETPPAGVQVVSDGATENGAQCPDCGPACANGCCHAPHSAVSPENQTPRTVCAFGSALVWSDATCLPLDRPAGPDRPPRS